MIAAPPVPRGAAETTGEVRVAFFGMMASLTGERAATVHLPAGATVAQVIAALSDRYGQEFQAEIMRATDKEASYCRISVNGRLIRSLRDPVAPQAGAATVEMILLSCQEGG